MPIYTYECPQGHQWDEVRTIAGSETSQEDCPECVKVCGGAPEEECPITTGRKIPARSSVKFNCPGATPVHYQNRKENK